MSSEATESLQIKGKSIEVLNKDNRYHSAYLSYSTYPSVSALTKKVVDDVPGFCSAQYLQRGRIEKLG